MQGEARLDPELGLLQSHCCTVHSLPLGTHCTAISPLSSGRFCTAESHGVFLQEDFVSFSAPLLWERSCVPDLAQNKSGVMKQLCLLSLTLWLGSSWPLGEAQPSCVLRPVWMSGQCACPAPATRVSHVQALKAW